MGNQSSNHNNNSKVANGFQDDFPLRFHKVHGQNVILSNGKTRASRGDSFCKGICFSNRPISINEKVYIRFVETCSSWSGVLRFGFTNIDPITLNNDDLPRYACPDLTNMSGNWAKALGERYAESANLLFFYITRRGDVRYGINGVEKGLFFSGVSMSGPLWALLDIYGNTVSVEFADPDTISSIPPSINNSNLGEFVSSFQLMDLSHNNSTNNALTYAGSNMAPNTVKALMPIIRFHKNVDFAPICFHSVQGRNIVLDVVKLVAMRRREEYCNGYVFTSRPVCNEVIVLQILAIDRSYVGGLAFGFTTCDPCCLTFNDLPDDADQFLDRHEYWVVNKDVCRSPDVGDELSFYLTLEGEVRYVRNTSQMTTLMHVDPTLPLWMFFDVYGNVQKIKILGSANPSQIRRLRPASACLSNSSGLTVALPPRQCTTASTPTQYHLSQSGPTNNNSSSSTSASSSTSSSSSSSAAMSTLVLRSLSMPATSFHHTSVTSSSSLSSGAGGSQQQQQQASTKVYSAPPIMPPQLHFNRGSLHNPHILYPSSSFDSGLSPSIMSASNDGNAITDNESNECNVCYERSINCVLYTCGHMCMCFECAMAVKKDRGALCPICRQHIKDVIKIFRS